MGQKIIAVTVQTESWLVSDCLNEEMLRKELDWMRAEEYSEEELTNTGTEELEAVVARILPQIELYHKDHGAQLTIDLRGEHRRHSDGHNRVWLFGHEITAEDSLKYRNHSPDGFDWGYGGSGPAQLALAICIKLFGVHKALDVYQEFKWKHIATLPQSDFELSISVDISILKKDKQPVL